MSTNSTVAVIQKDGQVKSIYSHWDGYHDGVGAVLKQYYDTYEKANELVALGSVSCIYEHVKPLAIAPKAYHVESIDGPAPMIKENEHSFGNQQADVVVAYHRDRGEEFSQEVYKSLDEYNKEGYFQEYNYLLKDGKWFTRRGNRWMVLTDKMCKLL